MNKPKNHQSKPDTESHCFRWMRKLKDAAKADNGVCDDTLYSSILDEMDNVAFAVAEREGEVIYVFADRSWIAVLR
jgi:hypothetical protein